MNKTRETARTFLTADDILALEDKEYEDVHVPEWDGYVRIQVMDGESRDAYEMGVYNQSQNGTGFQNMRATLVACCAVHPETGRRLFTDKQIKALGQKSGRALDRLFDVAQQLNGITEEDVAELEKNSEGAQNGDSGSS